MLNITGSKLEDHMPVAQFFHKAETSQMSALCFKLFPLSYSVLTFKSLKAKIHLLSWNHLLFICVIGTFWVQTKTTTESLLERPGTHSPLFRCQSCYSEMCSIRLLVVLHKVHSPDKNSKELSQISLGLLSASWSFFLPLQEARSVAASVVSPVDIQKVNIFTFFWLAFFSGFFFSFPFPFCCSWLITRGHLALIMVENWAALCLWGCSSCSRSLCECRQSNSNHGVLHCLCAVTLTYIDMILTVSCTSWFTFLVHFRKQRDF